MSVFNNNNSFHGSEIQFHANIHLCDIFSDTLVVCTGQFLGKRWYSAIIFEIGGLS